MSSRSKKRRTQTMEQDLPQQQGGRIVATARHVEQRPAQLTPDIIAKFDASHVDALVGSFCKSVEYQNETDRMSMQEHYRLQKSGQTKGIVVIFGLFGVSLGALYVSGKLEPWYILIAFIAASSVYFVPGIFNAISGMILSMRMKFKSIEKDPQK